MPERGDEGKCDLCGGRPARECGEGRWRCWHCLGGFGLTGGSDEETGTELTKRQQVAAEMTLDEIRNAPETAKHHHVILGADGRDRRRVLMEIRKRVRSDSALERTVLPVLAHGDEKSPPADRGFWETAAWEALEGTWRGGRIGDEWAASARAAAACPAARDRDRLYLEALVSYARSRGRWVLLLLEDMDRRFGRWKAGDRELRGWWLRHALQTEPAVMLVATAAEALPEIRNPALALYGGLVERWLERPT